MLPLLCLIAVPLLLAVLARPPRAREGAFLAVAAPVLALLAAVAWQNKQPLVQPGTRVNINTCDAASLARAADVPPRLAEAVMSWRAEKAGGLFRSLSQVPSLGRADRDDRDAIAALAAEQKERPEAREQLRAILRTGRVQDGARPGDRGLYPDLHRKWLAARALDPRLSLANSPAPRLLEILGDSAVVDRIRQKRYLEPNRDFDLPDALAVPAQRIVLRDADAAARWLAWAVGLPLLLALALHLLLRSRAPDWDPFLLPTLTSLGVLGVIGLFSASRALTDPALPFFVPGLYLPEFVRQGMALSLGIGGIFAWVLLPQRLRARAGDVARRSSEHFWVWGGLAFCLLAANLAARLIGRLGLAGWLLVLAVPIAAAAFYWRRRLPPPAAWLIAGGFILLLVGVRLHARSFGVLYIETAKLALAALLAAFAAAHDALLPDHVHHIPGRALRNALVWFAGCCALVIATGDLGFLLLLWLPACLLATIMLRRPAPLLVGIGTLVVAGVLVYQAAPLLQGALGWEMAFPDRWRMFRDPWHATSDQVANALYRITSVPTVLAGAGLGRGYRPESTADIRDVVLPFHFESLGAIGLVLILALYLVLLYRMFLIGLGAREAFPRWFVLGSASILAVQTGYTLAAGAGLLPLTGITAAPLASGAAAVLGLAAMVGVAMAAGAGEMRRPPRALARSAGIVYALAGALLVATFARCTQLALSDGESVALKSYRGAGTSGGRDNSRLAEAREGLPATDVLCRRSGTSWESDNLLRVAWSEADDADARRYQDGLLGEALLPAVGLRTPYGWAEGSERSWEELLTGVRDESLSVLDPGERAWRVKKGLLAQWQRTHHPFVAPPAPVPPEPLRLTLVADLQTEAYRRLKSYLASVDAARPLPGGQARRGIAAICDVRTGEYLAVAQAPSFAPNPALADWRRLDEVLHTAPYPLADNLRTTLRAPGSVAKINTIAALLQSKPALRRRVYRCAPGVTPGIQCMGGVNHGWVTPARILSVSCNRGAAQAARDAGWANLMRAYQRQKYRFSDEERARYGITRRVGSEKGDRGPGADFRDFHRFIAFGQVIGASIDETMRSACALANGGRLVSPHWRTAANVWEEQVWRPDAADTIAWWMLEAASPGGTAYRVWPAGTRYPSKTGSAQTGFPESDAWFVTFGPWDPGHDRRPRVAIVLWGERVGSPHRISEGTGSDMARRVGVGELMASALKEAGQ